MCCVLVFHSCVGALRRGKVCKSSASNFLRVWLSHVPSMPLWRVGVRTRSVIHTSVFPLGSQRLVMLSCFESLWSVFCPSHFLIVSCHLVTALCCDFMVVCISSLFMIFWISVHVWRHFAVVVVVVFSLWSFCLTWLSFYGCFASFCVTLCSLARFTNHFAYICNCLGFLYILLHFFVLLHFFLIFWCHFYDFFASLCSHFEFFWMSGHIWLHSVVVSPLCSHSV